ncbi:MAG: DUF2779 domain-containing protein [Mycoplasma sp.]
MKKTKLINKYDYVRYQTDNPALLFFNNTEIMAGFETKFIQLGNNFEIDEDEESEEEYETKEVDGYELYRQLMEDFSDIDLNNPKILEGIMIDKLSREHILEEYPNIKNVDLDEQNFRDLPKIAELTKEYLLQNENIIIFQSTFIHDDCITRPDAIVKIGNEISIIETKGTTTAKRKLFLDIFFQYKLLSKLEYLKPFKLIPKFCIVKYTSNATKGKCPLSITDCISFKKTLSFKDSVDERSKSLIKMGMAYSKSSKGYVDVIEHHVSIKKLCDEDYTDLYIDDKLSGSFKKFYEILENTHKSFDEDILTLKERKLLPHKNFIDIIEEVKPTLIDNNDWERSPFWPQYKKFYELIGYKGFGYCGYVVDHKLYTSKIVYHNGNYDAVDFKEKYLTLYSDETNEIVGTTPIVYKSKVKEEDKKIGVQYLSDKKVYFDFETISSPIKPIDYCLPFAQIITQCSIVKDHNDGTKIADLKCDNLLFDPLRIKVQDFKDLVDTLYQGEDYSYIVYNASFERSRLNELIQYIGETEYTIKINTIVANLYDLAVWFDVRKQNSIKIKQLKGFYSIKKVLPMIQKLHPEIFLETKCLDYKKLPVGNGLDCQNKTLLRFFGSMDDEAWAELSNDLKIYCENDVRAMIAVEYFGKKYI